MDAENSFIDWPARARPAAALRPVLPGSQPRARELVPRPEYGRLAVAVANESITLERNVLGEIGSI